ncbi:GIP [Symbiodinium natans]|uniref:GIP protein n=1 Tax=Symbiodinium natans TaxID=878477 RepID=A0A812HZD7_9DINO|nr:GIP [Symbiodinium natans]
MGVATSLPAPADCCQVQQDSASSTALAVEICDAGPIPAAHPVPGQQEPAQAGLEDEGRGTNALPVTEMESMELAEPEAGHAKSKPMPIGISKSQRVTHGRYSEVDMEIVRGISLRKSLANLGRVWRYSPQTWSMEDRMSLYQLSKEVPEFQMFISHTWRTPGRWKVLSLSFQCGWHHVLLCWCGAVFLCFGLCLADVLPMPFKYKARILGFTGLCPMGFWVLLGAFLTTVLSLASVPLLPDRCQRSDISFVDVTSIHQVDHMLMERGVYGIAGFLSISSELRILWSSPYLSRLWCVFELAAYKKVNPEGKITFRPLFVERVVSVMMASTYVFAMAFLIARDILGPGAILLGFGFAMWVCPYSLGIYLLRMNFREKHQLVSQLASFDLDQVDCAEKFDRDFIHAAIEKWYGSKSAFTQFVRQDLRQELEKTALATRIPRRYLMLMLTPVLSLSSEFFLANWKGGAPFECLFSFAVGIFIAFDIFYLMACYLLMAYLCDVLAPKRFGCLDHLQTLFVIVLVGLMSYGLQWSAQAYQASLAGAFIFLALSMVFAALMWWLEGKKCSQSIKEAHESPEMKELPSSGVPSQIVEAIEGGEKTAPGPASADKGQMAALGPAETEATHAESQSVPAAISTLGSSDRLTQRRYSEVDVEIVRGISLRKSLANLGRVWRYSPKTWSLEDRMSLYQLSAKVPKFQMFISHTWWTPGRWKVLSLSFQCGWHHVLLCWCGTVILCWCLYLADFLPMPFKYKARIMDFTELCPMGFWVLAAGFLSTVLSLSSVPLLPDRCQRSDISFVDVTSIHQVDHMLMERGVYGIAGFLSISSELRILWSSPYLSRLWCVFELAAYKKVNPEGKITLRPLFVERVVSVMMVSTYVFAMLFLIARDVIGPGAILLGFSFAMWVVPYSLGIYLLRMNFREKHQLISQLASFDLDQVDCAESFDRTFIHSAIEKWYGSKGAFTQFVRNDLRLELEKTALATRIPRRYLMLMLTPILSLSSEFFVANWKGGAPFECLFSFAVGIFVAFDIFYLMACYLLMAYLCDVLAPRRFGCLDHLQTLFVIVLVVGLMSYGVQWSAQAYQASLAGAFVFLAISVVFAVLMWWLEGRSRCGQTCHGSSKDARDTEFPQNTGTP